MNKQNLIMVIVGLVVVVVGIGYFVFGNKTPAPEAAAQTQQAQPQQPADPYSNFSMPAKQ